LKAEMPLGRWRRSLESCAAGGSFHLMKDDLSTLVWVVDNASALWVSRSRRGSHSCPGRFSCVLDTNCC
jgi:hypothetical protein